MSSNPYRAALIGGLFLLALAPAAEASAYDFAPRLAFGADPTTKMTIVWNAPAQARGLRLDYGPTPDLGTEVKGTQRDLGNLSVWPVYVALEHLQPDSEYYYQIRMGEQKDQLRRFRTAAAETSGFTFLAWGDQSAPGAPQAAGNAPLRVIELANRTDASFVLIAGDLSYAGLDEGYWNLYTELVSPLASRLPVMTVPGNHDLHGGSLAYRSRFRMPTADDERWYSFRYGNTAFVGLDTESFCNPMRSGSGAAPFDADACPEGLNEKQLGFLERSLREASDDEAIDWIVVYHHYPPHSLGKHGGNRLVQDHWGPLYERYGVDLVISAHDHLYLRSKPLAKDAAAAGAPTYVVVGTGGAQLYPHPERADWEAFHYDQGHGVLKVKVGAAQLEGEFVSVDGDARDRFTVEQAAKPAGAETLPSVIRAPLAASAIAAFVVAVAYRRRR